MDYSFIYLIHIFFGGPLLLYGGYAGKVLSEKCKDETHLNVFFVVPFSCGWGYYCLTCTGTRGTRQGSWRKAREIIRN